MDHRDEMLDRLGKEQSDQGKSSDSSTETATKENNEGKMTASNNPTSPESSSVAVAGQALQLGKGLDIGTANIICAVQSSSGDISITAERNAFLDIQADVHSKGMLTKLKVPYVVHESKLIVIGDSAFELANIFNRATRRPMHDGLISPAEVDALPMIRLIIEKTLGAPQEKGEFVYFSVPAESIDTQNNIVYHQGLFEGMLSKMGYSPKTINEGHAVVFAELAESDFTGIGISCGGGMFNVCVSWKTIPTLSFSISRGGDWIDKNVAEVLGIPTSRATFIKESGIDITAPKNRDEEAVSIYYRNLISYLLGNVKSQFESSKGMPNFASPVPIVFAGGTSKIGGFIDIVRQEFEKIDFPIPISEITVADEPLHSVARGCLVAAALGE
ncbi:MAG: hypothetical protein RL885_28820 [Planctomycetota bacterium]